MPDEINPITGKTNKQVLEESNIVAERARQMAGLPVEAFTPVKITNEALAPAPTPPVPTPEAPKVYEDYTTSVTKAAETNRLALEAEYKRQIEESRKKQEELQKQIDEQTKKQEGALGEVKTLTEPFREKLETAERERLYLNENFEANQKLTRELDTLLSEGNALIEQQRQKPIASAVQNRLVSKTMEEVASRSGVIQAVISARNGQIGQAERMIDRSVAAINADRNDQLSYYSSLMNFYENAKDEKGKKLVSLEKDEEGYIKAQISLIEKDVKRAQDYADAIKEAILDPRVALSYGEAGVSLSDSPEQIQTKLAKWQRVQENIKAERGEPGGIKFTNTQIAKGSATANLPIAEFQQLDQDTQNYFINNAEQINSKKKLIDEAKIAKNDPASIRQEIESSNLPEAVRNSLISYLKSVFPEGEKKSLPWWKRLFGITK